MDYDRITSLAGMFFEQAAKLNRKPFLWQKRDGAWHSWNYAETADKVASLARALAARGVEVGDRVAIVSENRPEWFVADCAIMTLGAVAVPAYCTNTVDDHLHVLSDSGAKVAIVSTARLAKRLIPAAEQAPDCHLVIAMEPAETTGIPVEAWDSLLAEGAMLPNVVPARLAAIRRDQLCCLIYTSGTGGAPKGVMLTNGSIACNLKGAHHLLKSFGLGDEIFLSLLPLSHSYEHSAGQFFPVSIGAQIYYCEGPEHLARNLEEVRPTIMTAVPRLYEALHGRIRRGVEKQGGLKAKLFEKAVEIGRKRYYDRSTLSLGDHLLDPVLNKLVRTKVQQRLGGRLKAFVSGGAPLNEEIGTFFLALGVKLLQGYGQTEASPVISCNYPDRIKIHTVGRVLPDVEVKIAEDGEIVVRGELVMKGYWNQPEDTSRTVVDGWLHTGDIGAYDEDNYLRITDRKKDIIVNSGGDNVAPARIEGFLTLEPEIAQAMAYGDKRPHIVALLVPDETFLTEWAGQRGLEPDLAVLSENPDLHKALSEAVTRVNAKLGTVEKVRKFIIAPAPFTVDNEQMTPTLKVRRHIVKRDYGDRLEALYAGG